MASRTSHRCGRRASRRAGLLRLALVGLIVACAAPCWGASYSSAGSGNWDTGATWSPNGVPGSGDTVSIGAHTITLVQNQSVGGIAFTAAGTITGGFTLTLAGSGSV